MLRRVLSFIAIAFALSCWGDRTVTAPEPTPDQLSQAVTGDAAAVVSDGKFVLPAPEATVSKQLSSGEAVVLARTWARQFGPLIRSSFEDDHGAGIRFDKLLACGRPLYAVSGFAEPADDILPAVRRAIGPWWLITLCDGALPQLSVSVSAWATELRIENGRLVYPLNSGAEFSAQGIPLGHVGEYPSSPERAAFSTAQQTGRRVTSVPQLVAGFNKLGNPERARWIWNLEGAVSVRTEKTSGLVSSQVLTGHALRAGGQDELFVGSVPQPDSVDFKSPPPLLPFEPRESYEERLRTQTRTVWIKRLPEIPAFVERVVAVEVLK